MLGTLATLASDVESIKPRAFHPADERGMVYGERGVVLLRSIHFD